MRYYKALLWMPAWRMVVRAIQNLQEARRNASLGKVYPMTTRAWPVPARFLAVLVVAVAIQIVVLHAMGQPAICACGVVRLWQGDVLGSENSQQLIDWYTP